MDKEWVTEGLHWTLKEESIFIIPMSKWLQLIDFVKCFIWHEWGNFQSTSLKIFSLSSAEMFSTKEELIHINMENANGPQTKGIINILIRIW